MSHIQAALKYIYTGEYQLSEGLLDWSHHLVLARFGKKCDLPELEQMAITALETRLTNATLSEFAWVLLSWDKKDYTSERLEEVVKTLREKHFDGLSNDLRLAQRTGDKSILQRCREKINRQGEVDMRCEDCGMIGKLYAQGTRKCENTQTKRHTWVRAVDNGRQGVKRKFMGDN